MIKALMTAILASAALAGNAGAQAPNSPTGGQGSPGQAGATCASDPRDYYPERALELGKGGSAVIHCTLAQDGRYQACAAVSEDPKGLGFGDAAVKMSCQFVKPPGPGGHVEGAGEGLEKRVVFTPPKQVCRNSGPDSVTCTFVWPARPAAASPPKP